MSSEPQEGSVREQLSAAEGSIDQNEEELCRQRRLLDISWNPQLQLHIAVLPQHWMTEEEDLCIQQRNFSVKQEEPEPPEIKEELQEPELPQIKEELQEPEPPQIKGELQEPEPPQIKEELQEPEPPQIKEEPGELCISHLSEDGSAASTTDDLASSSSSVNRRNASSTSTASTTARSRKRKSRMEATLEVFANKITSALKQDDTDILLKMQAAQHEHERKMFTMMTQFMERSFQPPQPPLYQAPIHRSRVYSPIRSSTPSTQFPVASSPSPFPPVPFFQDLNRLPFNNAHQHPHLNQSFYQAPGHTQAFNEDHLPPSQCKDDETHFTNF
ncbi:uncharacterized protein LOC110016685 isoform X4 [Oryzias latipes]